ncbi:MAG: hypothetical protein ACREBI_06705 [Nitrosotalea sp.]
MLEFLPPFTSGEKASLVLGQGDFVSTGSVLSATGLDPPYGMTFDNDGNMWVADTNNRVLEFATPSVPEFGPVVPAVLTLSTISIIIISARTKLQFPRF